MVTQRPSITAARQRRSSYTTPVGSAASNFAAQREYYRQQYEAARAKSSKRKMMTASISATPATSPAKSSKREMLTASISAVPATKTWKTKAASNNKKTGVYDELGTPAGLTALPKTDAATRHALISSRRDAEKKSALDAAIKRSDEAIFAANDAIQSAILGAAGKKKLSQAEYEKNLRGLFGDAYADQILRTQKTSGLGQYLMDGRSPTEGLITAGTSALGGAAVGAAIKVLPQVGSKIATGVRIAADGGSRSAGAANKAIEIVMNPAGKGAIKRVESAVAGDGRSGIRKSAGNVVGNVARSATTPINAPLNVMGALYAGDVGQRVTAADSSGKSPTAKTMLDRAVTIGVTEVLPFSVGLKLGSSGALKLIDRAATRGKTFIPIEQIGYESGIPLNQRQTAKSIRKSFEKNTYYPPVERFSSFGGRSTAKSGQTLKGPERARLPTQNDDGMIVWHATPNRNPFQQESIRVGGSDSELAGLYAAPAATGYYAKAGAGKSDELRLFSTGNMLRASNPGLVTADVKSINIVPKSMRKDWEKINKEFTDPNSLTVPLMKAEYEGVIPPGSEYRFTGSRYYTKIEGRRVPILELKSKGNTLEVVEGVGGSGSSGGGRGRSSVSGYSEIRVEPDAAGVLNLYTGVGGSLTRRVKSGGSSSGKSGGGSSSGKGGSGSSSGKGGSGSSSGKGGSGSSSGKGGSGSSPSGGGGSGSSPSGGGSGSSRGRIYEEEKRKRHKTIVIKTKKPYTTKETVNQLPWLEVDKVPPAKPIRLWK